MLKSLAMLSLTLFLAAPLTGSSLPQLQSTLASLNGRQRVAGVLEVQTWSQNDDDGENHVEQGKTQVRIEDSSGGLHILYGAAELQKAAAESASKDPEKKTPTRGAMRAIDAVETAEFLNFAPVLARALDGAKLQSESDVPFDGKTARLLQLKLNPPMSARQKKRIKNSEFTLKLWLAPDGTPIAAERVDAIKAKFLMMSFENRETTSYRFIRAGDRLVVARQHQESAGSGMGQKFRTRNTVTIRLDG
jgi:hypothetical protein